MIQTLLTWHISSTIYCSITIVLILIFKKALSKIVSPKFHYAIWSLLLIRLLLPFSLEHEASLYGYVNQFISSGIELTNPFSTLEAVNDTSMIDLNSETPNLIPDKISVSYIYNDIYFGGHILIPIWFLGFTLISCVYVDANIMHRQKIRLMNNHILRIYIGY